MGEEKKRLKEANSKDSRWRLWGPYVSDRQWGTVREDYSPYGDAWEYFPHELARSRAYRWGEDGIGGISDWRQRLCFAMAFWNEKDPIIKERYFGLTSNEGNHGEDVKEYYYYLDNTPTHSYMKMLYKYPQSRFPYEDLVLQNRNRGKNMPEYELLDTGIFNENRYFDIYIEYSKASPSDILIKITALNRGPESAKLHLLPQLWFRNTWSWKTSSEKPKIYASSHKEIVAKHPVIGTYRLYAEEKGGMPMPLFCDNETNYERVFHSPSKGKYFKDGINDYLITGNAQTINPELWGTKASLHYAMEMDAGSEAVIRLRLSNQVLQEPFQAYEINFASAVAEANEFYAELQKDLHNEDLRNIQRQALAGMLWTKQYYHYDAWRWLEGDPGQPPPPANRKIGRNCDWKHLYNEEIITMPDKWEYPWYAAWDLAFQCIPLAMIDSHFAKEQLILMTREWYMHPNGQLPAYEWALGDANPPVHGWASWRVYQIDRNMNGGVGDLAFLEKVFHKLMINFTWWVNKKDAKGRNLFQGGFLGLDNIGVFDRNTTLPGDIHLNQADGTSWMAMYALNLMRIALELALYNPVYEDIASKFFEHFLGIAESMTQISGLNYGLWDDNDKFYYDVLELPNRKEIPLKLRSIVGLIPLFAVETLEPETLERLPGFCKRLKWVLHHRPGLAELISQWEVPGRGERHLLSLLRGHRMKCLLRRMFDENEFFSPFGVRALSKYYESHPFQFSAGPTPYTVTYQPAESDTTMFGGNSNWRGPIWFPINYLIIESLQKFHHYYGDDFKIECPKGSGIFMTLLEASEELSRRLIRLFTIDANGKRPLFNQYEKMQNDPHFKDNILFYEYFHGDNGRGVGASHQTGWTGLIAKMIQPRRDQSELHEQLLYNKEKD